MHPCLCYGIRTKQYPYLFFPTLPLLSQTHHITSLLQTIKPRQTSLNLTKLIRTKMWDPVKDCSDPNTTQADVPGFLSALSTLPPHLRDSSGQGGKQSVESITRESVLMGIQPRHHGNLHDHAQEQGQMTGIETRMPTSTASPEITDPLDPPANMSRAISMMRDAETLAQQSRRPEAVRAYEEACALLQDVIIKSFSLEERMACNDIVSQ